MKALPPLRYPDLGLICLGLFVMLVGVGAVVPVRTIYARDHGATMAELGLLGSSFLLGTMMSQLPGGWASDKWGRKPLLVAGVAIAGVISFLFLAWDHPWYFIVLRFIEGVASGGIAPAANAYVMDSVPAKERGAAFGWVGSSFSAGFMVGPAIGGIMVDYVGYASPFIFGGVTSLATAYYMWRKMRDLRPGTQPVEPAEEQIADPGKKKINRRVPGNLRTPALIAALVLMAASGIEDGLFMAIWTLWLDDLGASTSYIGLTFITFSLPLMLFMPITGKLADTYRLAPMIAIPAFLASFVYLSYASTTDFFIIAALGLVEGTLVALRGPALAAFIANLSPDEARGRLQGVVSTTRTVSAFGSSMVVALLYGIGTKLPFLMLAGVQLTISIVGGLLIWWIERRIIASGPSEEPQPAEVIEIKELMGAPAMDSAAK